MSTNFPASADDNTTLPNPTASSTTNSPSLSSGQSNQNDAIKAIEAKLGTGASTPTNNTFLVGNGAGTSAFSSLTSAQLAARISDETGSGAAVFATSPTLVAPSVNTINEATAANGVTVDGLNIKDSKLNTNDSVVTANITDSAVTTAKLNSDAVTPAKLGDRDYQTDNNNAVANTTNGDLRIQFGWGQVLGNGTANVGETVTFPTAFTTVLGVATSIGGARTSVASAITGIDTGFSAAVSASWDDVTTTTVRVELNRASGTFGNTTYYAYSWIAWGLV